MKRGTEQENLTGVNNVTVSSDVVEGLRAVLLDPRSGLAVAGKVASDEDALALVGP